MKCDLCKRDTEDGSTLCNPCSEMVGRLVAIQRRLKSTEVSVAERLGQTSQAAGASR